MNFEKVCRRLLEYAVLAPSIYNSQPWKFAIDPAAGTIQVFPDEERARPLELDPTQRDLYLALGACLENMVLAGPSLGYETQAFLSPPVPHSGRLTAVAQLSLKTVSEVMPDPLFPALMIRHNHAGAYQSGSVADLHLERLRFLPTFSDQEKIYLMTEDSKRAELVGFLHDLSHEGSQNPVMVKEGAQWITPQSRREAGLPMAHIGLPLSVKVRFALLRYLDFERELKEVARQTLLRQGHGIEAPAFLLMTTRNPGPAGYVNAGRWTERIMLTLNEIELGFQTLHLPISLFFGHINLRRMFGAGEGEEPVLLLRFGKPERKIWPKTSRRQVEQCLLRTFSS